jgi:hypothetical protein
MSGPEGSASQPVPPAAPPPAAPPPTSAAPPPSPPVAPAPPAGPSAMDTMLAGFSRGEQLILLGALVVVLVDIVFDLLLDRYPFSDIIVAGSVAALLAVFLGSRMAPGSRTARMIAVGAIGVVVYLTARNLWFDLRALSVRVTDGMFLVGALALYLGVGLMIWGALQVWRSRTA